MAIAGVAAEVLVGEEQHLVAPAPVVKAHSSTARALVEVHTAPPCSADERLQRRRGVHVGDRHDPLDVDDLAERLPGLLDLSMSAMSAIEQPALRSGRITCWWSPVRMSADSAMKCTPQNTMYSAWGALGEHGQPEESPRASAQRMTSSRW
jgi:hypothetical protein